MCPRGGNELGKLRIMMWANVIGTDPAERTWNLRVKRYKNVQLVRGPMSFYHVGGSRITAIGGIEKPCVERTEGVYLIHLWHSTWNQTMTSKWNSLTTKIKQHYLRNSLGGRIISLIRTLRNQLKLLEKKLLLLDLRPVINETSTYGKRKNMKKILQYYVSLASGWRNTGIIWQAVTIRLGTLKNDWS